MEEVSKLLSELEEICKNPAAQMHRYMDAGETVVGCFPVYTSQPLVTAAGMVPMGIWGGHAIRSPPANTARFSPVRSCIPAWNLV